MTSRKKGTAGSRFTNHIKVSLRKDRMGHRAVVFSSWLVMLNVVTLFVALTLVGVEFSISAFVNPAAERLEPEPRLKLLSRLAIVLGRVMPVWYPVSALLYIVEMWLHWRAPGRNILLTATVIWALAAVASIFFLVPLNSRVAQGAADWERVHRTWDRRHRARVAALATAAVLLTYFLTP